MDLRNSMSSAFSCWGRKISRPSSISFDPSALIVRRDSSVEVSTLAVVQLYKAAEAPSANATMRKPVLLRGREAIGTPWEWKPAAAGSQAGMASSTPQKAYGLEHCGISPLPDVPTYSTGLSPRITERFGKVRQPTAAARSGGRDSIFGF